MSYFSTDGMIEYGGAAQVLSHIRGATLDGGMIPRAPRPPEPMQGRAAAQIRRQPRGTRVLPRGQDVQATGACCSDCARGGLGATPMVGGMSLALSPIGSKVGMPPGTNAPPLPPGAIPPPGMYPAAGGGMSPIVKLALLAGVGVGGFLLIRRLRAKKAA